MNSRSPTSDSGRFAAWPTIGLVALVVAAAALRFSELGAPSLDVDEYWQAVSAVPLLETGRAMLPDGSVYQRAPLHTHFVAMSYSLLGVSEVSARLPAALFGTLLVGLVFVVGRTWFGTAPALIAAGLVAVLPGCVEMSRLCRMYAPFHVTYLATLFAYERAWLHEAPDWHTRLRWSLAGVGFAGAGLLLHELSVTMGIGLLAYWLLRSLPPNPWWNRVFAGMAVIAPIVLESTGVVSVSGMWREFTVAPAWAAEQAYDPTYYLVDWTKQLPWMWLGVAFGAWHVIRRRSEVGLFLCLQLLVPLTAYSLVFEPKFPRYATHLLPLAALLIAPGLWNLTLWSAATLRPRLPGALSTAMLAVIGGVLLATPIARSSAMLDQGYHSPWRDALLHVRSRLAVTDTFIVSVPLTAAFYLPEHRSYALNEWWTTGNSATAPTTGEPKLYIRSAEQLDLIRCRSRSTWIVSTQHHWETDATPEAIRAVVDEQCERTKFPGREQIFVYRCAQRCGQSSRT